MMYRLAAVFVRLMLCFMALEGQGVLGEKGLPEYPEWLYQKRLNKLNEKTPIALDYNESVKAYIDVYTVKRREHLSEILALSKYYFPMFEECLAKYNLPLELKYLAVVESALDPQAKSSSGAMGLWQFLYHAAKMFDLSIDSYVDERCDPLLATDAACKYLQYLYLNFNDWHLALAAYNGGIGVVKKAIARSGGKTNYWDLRPYLPDQVKGYVPAFIAANYALSYYDMHSIVPAESKITHSDVDTVYIRKSTTFSQLASVTGVDLEVLTWLNPKYIKNYIPVLENQNERLFIPSSSVDLFIQNEQQLYVPPVSVGNNEIVGSVKGREKSEHWVGSGEYFHKIAMTYSCRIEDVMYWNDMISRDLKAGQRLIVWKLLPTSKTLFIRKEVDFNFWDQKETASFEDHSILNEF